jgi:hypothetical protein
LICHEEHERPRRHARPLSRNPLEILRGPQSAGSAEALAPATDPHFEGVETASRLRPLARRRCRTARPPCDFMRLRNP